MARDLGRRRWVAVLANPPVALGLWLVTWYATHIPAFYDYALRHEWALGFEHLAFVVSGLVFWWPEIVSGYLSPIGKVSYLALAFLAISPLSLLIYLANSPLYSFYEHTPKLGDISALADQQIAGVAMAVESNVVLLTVMVFALMRLLSDGPAAEGPADA
jgi:cytochrome c oxidase assembly factor CtaG